MWFIQRRRAETALKDENESESESKCRVGRIGIARKRTGSGEDDAPYVLVYDVQRGDARAVRVSVVKLGYSPPLQPVVHTTQELRVCQ